ncbi:MAG: DUF4126 domain-containing protein [Ignavibacteriales bacterium]|nr:DUF4126 domain-containing protein [Ignavibacteriales bacterium]
MNAYIPLLVVGLLARYTNLLALSSPWDTLASPWIILMLCGLVIIEMLADMTPARQPRQRPDPDLHPSRCGSHRLCSQRQCCDRRQPGAGLGGRSACGRDGSPHQIRGGTSGRHSHYGRYGQHPRQHRGGCYLHGAIHRCGRPADPHWDPAGRHCVICCLAHLETDEQGRTLIYNAHGYKLRF